MNFSQVCRQIGDNKLSDLSMSVVLVDRINRDLPIPLQIDIDLTGNEALKWFADLEGHQPEKLLISLGKLTTKESYEFKIEAVALTEHLRAMETHDNQIKHNMVMIYVTLAVALTTGCLYTYLSTKGVDVETSSQLLSAAKSLVVFLFEVWGEE